MIKKFFLAVCATLTSVVLLVAVSYADTALHGYCDNGCVDNGINSPSIGTPTNFGFTIGAGPTSGTLLIDLLIPNNTAPGSFSIGATSFSQIDTAWTSGNLSDFLVSNNALPGGGSPTNPLGAYLPSTQTFQPSATGFFVFQGNLGTQTLQSPSNPNSSPLFNLGAGQTLPFGSYIVGFLNIGGESSSFNATANSGAIFVPEPASLLLLGSGLAGIGLWRMRKQR